MPAFNPAIPVNASLIASGELRDNFNALKGLIDGLPPPPAITSGSGSLDGGGVLDISGMTSGNYAVGSWYNTPGTGQILTLPAPLRIVSSMGGTDAGLAVCWIAF